MIKDKRYYSKKLLEISRLSDIDDKLLDEARNAYIAEDFDKIDEVLIKLSPDYKLLESLIQRLKGKSVYSGLKKITEDKDASVEQAMISTSSLLTHVILEIRENRKEYRKLVPELLEKLQLLEKKL